MARSDAAARFIFVTLLLDVVGIGIIIPILPGLVQSLLGSDPSTAARYYGPLVALYAVTQTLASPLLGALSDRYGRRPVILVSMVGMGISYLVMGFAPTLVWLFIGRALAGVTGATITSANAYMADISTPETRAQNFGLVGAAFGVGFVFGPAIGGVLGEVGPRVPLFGAAAVSFLNVLWGVFVLPESLPLDQRRALSLADANPLAGIRNLRTHPGVWGLALVFVLQSFAQRGLESVWVLYTGYRYGWSELENGLTLALVGVGAAIVQGGLVRRIVPWLGEPRALVIGLVLNVVALLLYGSVPQGWMILLVIPIGAISAIAGPALQGLITSMVEPERQGTIQGALASAQSLTAIFAPLVAATLFAWATDDTLGVHLPGIAFYLGAAVLVVAILQAVRTLRRLAGAPQG